MVAVANGAEAPAHASEPSFASAPLARTADNRSLLLELRNATGAGVVECRNALVGANWEMEAAKTSLRSRMQAKAGKLEANEANVIVVGAYVHHDGSKGALARLATQTDFVARTDDVKSLARDIAMHVVATGTTGDIMDEPWVRDASITVKEKLPRCRQRSAKK